MSPEKSSLYNTGYPVTLALNWDQALCGAAGGADQTGSPTLLVFLLAVFPEKKKQLYENLEAEEGP